jgi:hypothetical protein
MDQVIPPVATDGVVEVEGGHEGLYGGSLNEQVCDRDTLVEFLAENPEEGAAWAEVLGISMADIPDYVAGLTPVLLRSDTLVTNHGFVDGHATSFVAVLEAGTAVLVDDRGVPVTKCYCGNPLTPPPSSSSPFEFSGPTWDDFSEASLTVIEENETVIEDFIVVDPTTRQGFTRPAGTDGSDDRPTTEQPDTDTAGEFDGTYALEFTYGDDPLRPDVGCLATPTAGARYAEGTLVVTGSTATLTLPDIRISMIRVGSGGLIDFLADDPEEVPHLNYLRVTLVIGEDGEITSVSKWRADSTDHALRCGGPIYGQRVSSSTTAMPSSSDGPCTQAAFLAAIADPEVSVLDDDPLCAGSFASVSPFVDGEAVGPWLFHWNGTEWERPSFNDLTVYCENGSVPAAIYDSACPHGGV